MKKRFFCTMFLFALTLGTLALSKDMTEKNKRLFYYRVLDNIEEYITNSHFSDETSVDDFLSQFENDEVLVYNDLMGCGSEEYLPVKDYVARICQEQKIAYAFNVKNIKKEKLSYTNGQWQLSVSFDKTVRWVNKCGVLFSSKEYYDKPFHLVMILVWDDETECAKISGIEKNKSDTYPPLPESYSVVKYQNKYDEIVQCNGSTLKFNTQSQAFVAEPCSFYIEDDDIAISNTKKDSCGFYRLKYRVRKWRIRPNINIGFNNTIKIKGITNDIQLTKSNSIEVGADFGYNLYSKRNIKLSSFLGVAYSTSEMRLKMVDQNYVTPTTGEADIDGDAYDRYYKIRDASNTIKYKDFSFPIYLDAEFKINYLWSIYADAGVKGYINLASDCNSFNGSYTTYGLYKQYDNLIIDQSANINGFIENGKLSDVRVESNLLDMKTFSLDVYGSLGIRYRINRIINVELGCQYQRSIINPYETNSFVSLTPSSVSSDEAILSYDLDKNEKIKPFTAGINALSRSAFKLNISLFLKF